MANEQNIIPNSERTPQQREEIAQLVFGENGLKPSVMKLFLDPFHQTEDHINSAGGGNIDLENYDHKTTTRNMIKRTNASMSYLPYSSSSRFMASRVSFSPSVSSMGGSSSTALPRPTKGFSSPQTVPRMSTITS